MAAAGSFKRPWLQQREHPRSGRVRPGGLGRGPGRSGEFKPCEDGVWGLGVGRKLELTHLGVHPDTSRASPVTAPLVRSRAAGRREGGGEGGGGGSSIRAELRSSAALVLRPRSPRR